MCLGFRVYCLGLRALHNPQGGSLIVSWKCPHIHGVCLIPELDGSFALAHHAYMFLYVDALTYIYIYIHMKSLQSCICMYICICYTQSLYSI